MALFGLYSAFWFDPRTSDDVTVDFAVFFVSPIIFALALAGGLLSTWTSSDTPANALPALLGNLLTSLCLSASVGWLLLLVLAEVAFSGID